MTGATAAAGAIWQTPRTEREPQLSVPRAPLVGRQRELARLQEVLGRAFDGSPGMVVVAGDAGVGKTRFVREVADRAAADGWTVLSGACVELSEGAAVLAPVADVLRQLARERGDAALAALLSGPARFLSPLLPEFDVEGEETGEAQVLVSFHRLLRDVAEDGPLLLVLEDLHWADATTRDLLRHLAARLHDERLLVLATVRTDDLDRRHPLRPVLAEVVRRPEVDRIDLGPLTGEELVEHLARLGPDDLADDDLAAIAHRAGGNPFHAEELLAAGGDRLPPSLEDALRLRLDRLPPDAQQLLSELAVIGATVDADLVPAVTTLDTSQVSPALRAALDDGVLVLEGGGYAFRHALLREVALDRLLPHERVQAHAVVAAALEADPDRAVVGRAGASGQAAHHWWEARDLPRCLAASVAAAREAERTFASVAALRHLERALELWERVEDPEGVTGTTRLALAMAAADAAEAAADPRAAELGMAAVAAADAEGDASARAAAIARLAITLTNDGRIDEAVRVTAEERARHGEHERTVPRALSLTASAMAVAWAGESRVQPWDLDAAAADLDLALEIARECADWFAEYRALAGIVQLHGVYLPGRLEGAVERGMELVADATAGVDRYAIPFLPVISQVACGDYAGADASLRRWRDLLPDAASPRVAVIAGAGAASAIDAALGRVERMWEHVETVDLRDVGSYTDAVDLLIGTGDWLRWSGHARRALDRAEFVAAAFTSDIEECEVAAELAASHAALGDPLDVVAAIARNATLRSASRATAMSVARLTSAVVDAAAGQQVDQELLTHLHELVAPIAAYVDWLREDAPVRPWAVAGLRWARAELAQLDGAPDPALWDPVVALLETRGHLPQVAVARLRRAFAHAASGHGGSPACEADLLAAWGVASDLGLTGLQHDAEALARRLRITLPARTGSPSEAVLPDLTDREREVLSLVAEGWTNKRVGEHLFISPKTVSVHMSNAMRKLDVDSRTEAVAVAHRAGLLARD